MTEQERLKILETNKPQSYFQATGLNPFAKPPLDRTGVEDYLKSIGRATTDFTGIKQLGENQFDISGVILPESLPNTDTAGGLPENGLGIGGNFDYSSILKDLSGGNIASSVNIEELVANQMAATQAELEKTRTQREENIKKQFEPLKEQVTAEGEKAIGGIKAISARGGGLGASNIAEGMIRDQEKANKLVLADLEAKIVSAIASDDATKKKEYMDTYAQVIDQQDKLFNQKIKSSETRLKVIDTLMGIKTAEAGITGTYNGQKTLASKTLDLNTLNQLKDIPEGQSIEISGITYTGLKKETIEPFFKGSDIVDLMIKTPIGEAFQKTDPNTGMTYTIEGLATPEPTVATANFTNNSTGEVKMFTYDKNTGEIVAASSLGKIGQRTIFQTPASIQEYNLAVKQGFKGRIDEYQKTKTPTSTDELRQVAGNNFDKSLDLLEKSKGTSGFVNPSLYIDLMNKFKSDYPDKPNMFIQLFSPQQYLDPQDPIAQPLLKQSENTVFFNYLIPPNSPNQ